MPARSMGPLSCYNLQERIIPHVRAQTAKRLASQGLRQGRIADHLGVSQAMVSKYLRGAARPPRGVPAAALQAVVERAVTSALEQERLGRLPAWCPICPEVWSPDASPALARGTLDECARGELPHGRDEAEAVLENVRAAARRVQRAPFARLAPEVNINIAMAVRDARDARGVAALPGRLVEVRGELRALGDPEFGASNHLSQLLLRVRRAAPVHRAVMCLRDAPSVRRAAKAAGLRVQVLKRARGELVLALARAEPPDALIDPGDFGIEPITYLLGETALHVVDKAERLLRALTQEVTTA